MSDDKWVDAWSQLTRAMSNAFDAGMTKEEILDIVEENDPTVTPDKIERQSKPKKGLN